MFKLFKRIATAIWVLSCSVTFAGSMGPICVPGKIDTFCTQNAWSLGGKALYLQPSFGGNGLGYTAYSNYSGNDNNGNFVGASGTPDQMSTILPRWGWGFQIDGAYHFDANDIAVNWYHLNTNRQSYFPTGTLFSGNNDGFYAGSFQVASKWDELDIEVGQQIQVVERKKLRLHAGVEFARIRNQFNNAPRLNPTSIIAYTTTDTLSYHGFGPRLGADFGYLLGHDLELYAKAAGSMLIGTTKQWNSGYQNYPYPNNPISPFVTGNYNQSNRSVIVPELGAQLGAQYDWLIAGHTINVDLGYMWVNYLHSIVSYAGNGIVFPNIGGYSNANFNLNGLYFGVQWGEDL